MKKILPKLKHFAQFFLAKFSHNLLLKLLAFLLSLALWTYVVSNDTTITRKITISGLSGYVNGKTTLETNNLALLDDPYTALSDISVQLDVPQAQYSSVTAANVQVSLDVSNIRTAGLQSVPIRASTTTGKVLNVYPSSVDLTFEALDTRSIPINVILENTSDKYWYSVTKTNPQQLTVSGPTSLVSEVVQAIVYADMSDIKTPFTKANSYELLNSSGEKINAKMLSDVLPESDACLSEKDEEADE